MNIIRKAGRSAGCRRPKCFATCSSSSAHSASYPELKPTYAVRSAFPTPHRSYLRHSTKTITASLTTDRTEETIFRIEESQILDVWHRQAV